MTIIELAGIVAKALPDKQVWLGGPLSPPKGKPTSVVVTEKFGREVLLTLTLSPEGAIRAEGTLKLIANQPAV